MGWAGLVVYGDVNFGFSCLLSPMKVYRFQKKFPDGFLVDREQMLGRNGMKLTKKGKNGMKLTKKG